MLNNDFSSSVGYDYDREYFCESNGCDREGICRCSSINNITIDTINLSNLTDNIYYQLNGNPSKSQKRDLKISTILYGGEIVDKYCIYRLLVYYKVFDTESWSIDVVGGYYGEEIGDVSIDSPLFKRLQSSILELGGLQSLSDKLKFCLNLEYGHILPELETVDFEVISIYKTYIDFKKLNQEHIENCKQEDLTHYSSQNYSLPRGIVKRKGDTYTIVDGYHRIIATDQKAFEVFLVKE